MTPQQIAIALRDEVVPDMKATKYMRYIADCVRKELQKAIDPTGTPGDQKRGTKYASRLMTQLLRCYEDLEKSVEFGRRFRHQQSA